MNKKTTATELITEKLGMGYAQYSTEGKIQMIGYNTPKMNRFQRLLKMRGALKNMGYYPTKSDWGIGWILRIPWFTGHPNGDTFLCATHTLYLDENEKWTLYQAVSNYETGEDLDDEKLITNNASHSEVQGILYAFQNPPPIAPEPDCILD